jgi:pimeloyl-ACP methyl ester carboxylesterase
LIWGAQDEVIAAPPTPVDTSSSVRSETVPGGHSPHVEQPAVVREIITEFLSQIPTEVSRDV